MPNQLSGKEAASGESSPQAAKPASGSGDKSNGSYSLQSTKYSHAAGRAMPHSSDAEQGVLGSILIAPEDVLVDAIERIKPEYFHLHAHRLIYESLIALWDASKPIDLVTLTEELRRTKLLDQVGGAGFIADLFTLVPTAANATFYMDILREKFLLRRIITTCTECSQKSYDQEEGVDALLDSVEQQIFTIAEDRFRQTTRTMQQEVMDAVNMINKLYENRGALSGLPTGFKNLDQLTGGLHEAEMFIVAARPSMGKTALAMNIAEHVAVHEKKSVAVFSLEMSTQQLVQRLLCSVARVNLKKTREGFLGAHDWPKLMEAAEVLASSKVYIDDTAGLSILELRAKARRMKAQHGIDLIVVDYLQLLRSPSRRAQDNRQLEIAEISAGIKALAKELYIPIIVLAQLNRQPEQRAGGKPRLSDLRESGSIEQDADIVGLLVRQEYYEDDEEGKEQHSGEAELIIAKQRNGPTGEVKLSFLKEFTRFEDRAFEHDSE